MDSRSRSSGDRVKEETEHGSETEEDGEAGESEASGDDGPRSATEAHADYDSNEGDFAGSSSSDVPEEAKWTCPRCGGRSAAST